ncbi:MAG: hypothetical protein IPP64_06660 [Bacteroidetes bacterium]|nr:hypothetical protein [Bacteroidota bacterium]
MSEILFSRGTIMDWTQSRKNQIIKAIADDGDSIADLKNPVQYKKSIIDKYSLSTIAVDFDNVVVRPHFRDNPNHQSVWIEYKVPFTGEQQLLSVNSGARVAQRVDIDATIDNNAFSFETFTGYHQNLTLPADIVRRMNANLVGARQYVEAEVAHVNIKIADFNEALTDFVTETFDAKVTAINAKRKSGDDLNPFKK